MWQAEIARGPRSERNLAKREPYRLVAFVLAMSAVMTGGGASAALLEEAEGIAAAGDGTLLVVDAGARAVVQVDPVTGETSIVSDDGTGGGPPLRSPVAIALESGGSALVADTGLVAILRVDLATGDRFIVSDAQTGGGPLLVEPVSLVTEFDGSAVVVDRRLAAVVRVDPLSGDRVVVSDAATGRGPLLELPQGIDIEATGALLVGDRPEQARAAHLLRVDPLTGDRTLVSGPARGEGKGAGLIVDVEVLGDGQVVLVDNSAGKQLLLVDPVTGDRERLSGRGVGGGPPFEDPRSVVSTEAGLMVAEAGLDAVVRVDPLDGSRYILGGTLTGSVTLVAPSRIICRNETTGQTVRVQSAESAWDCEELGLAASPGDVVFTGAWGTADKPGGGPQFDLPQGVAVEADGHIIVADQLENAVFRVDPVSGDRAVLSDDNTGTGPVFDNPAGVAVEAIGTILVTDHGNDTVLRLDPITGDRTIVSDQDHGGGLNFGTPLEIEVDADGTLLVADGVIPGIFRVDSVTGDRTVVSGGGVGTGPGFLFPWGLAIEADGNLLVADPFLDALFRVDVASGDRLIIAEDFIEPRGTTVEDDSQVLVAEAADAVLRVDPLTGGVSVVSDATRGTGPLFDEPSWIGLEANGDVLVADLTSLYRVDPLTGDRLLLSGPGLGSVGGSIAGVEFPAEATCRNIATGQVVKDGVEAGTSWDCESHGLDVEDDDPVFTGARAIR